MLGAVIGKHFLTHHLLGKALDMATFSVWDHANRRYAYYQTPKNSAAVNAPKPVHLKTNHELGLVPDEAAWPLPSDAKLVGFGKMAKGKIATVKPAFSLSGTDILGVVTQNWPWVLAGAGLAWVLYKKRKLL